MSRNERWSVRSASVERLQLEPAFLRLLVHARVLDGQRRLVGKRGGQPDLVVGELARLTVEERQTPVGDIPGGERHRQHRAVAVEGAEIVGAGALGTVAPDTRRIRWLRRS